MKRKINKIILHCSDTKTNQSFGIATIRKWHTDPKPIGRGWNDVGYHIYIRLNGTVEYGRDLDEIGAHAFGFNSNSIGICLEGGKNPDGTIWNEPTPQQMKSVIGVIVDLRDEYGDEITVHGHYEFSQTKTCPNFDVCILEDYLKK